MSDSEPQPTMARRDLFLYWWPVASRILGTTLVGYTVVATHPPDAGLLALAGSLLLAPNVAESQRRRNGKRDEDES